MIGMFEGCTAEKINFDNFNTNNVNDMSCMFKECKSLEKLNLNQFNTNNVGGMGRMFYGCSELKELYLDNFNTNNVTNMKNIFGGCSTDLVNKILNRYKNLKINNI